MRLVVVLIVLLPLASAAQDAEEWLSLEPLHEELAPALSLHLTPALSDTTAFDVAYADDGERLSINGCPHWYGTDGDEPTTYLQEGYIDWEGRRLDLDVSCITTCEFCPYGGFTATPLESTSGWAVTGTLSDGAGTTYVTWLVAPTGTVRTQLERWDTVQEREEYGDALENALRRMYEGMALLQEFLSDAEATDEIMAVAADLAAEIEALQRAAAEW